MENSNFDYYDDLTLNLCEAVPIPECESINSDGSTGSAVIEYKTPESYVLTCPYPYGSMTPEDLALRRERNRLAAAKCRAKKAEKFNTLKNHHEKLVTDNQKLREKNLELKSELELQKMKLHYVTMKMNSGENRDFRFRPCTSL